MNLQILVGSDTTEIMIAGGAVPRKPAAKNRPGVISPAHQKPRPHRAPVPLLGSPGYRCSARFRSSKPGLPPGLVCLPVCQPGPLDSLEAPPFLSLSPSTQKGSNFLHHFLPQLLGLADSTSFSPGDGERALSPCTPLFSFMEIAGLRALSHPSTSGKGRIWTRAQTQA